MPLVELEDAEIDFPDGMDGREVQGILDSIVGDFQEDLRRTGIKTSEYLGRLADNSVIISTIQGMRPEDRTALLTSMIPGVGDVAGTYADYTDIKKNFSDAPWHTKAAMVGGTLLGILPLFPSRTQVKAAAESLGAGYDAAWFKRQSDVGTAIFNEDAFEISKAAREKIKLYRGESPQVSDPRSPWWTEDIGRAESYGDVRSIEVDPEKRLVLDRFTGRSGNITDTEVNPDGMRELRRILGDEKTNRLDKGEFAHSVLDDADYAKIKESGYDSVVFGDDEGIQDYIIGGGPPRKIKAFHGSPHDFPPVRELKMPDGERVYQSMADAVPDGAEVLAEHPLGRFDMSKIGTGEGAQAYGHGLYFADEIDVAKGYQPRSYKAEEMMLKKYKAAERSEDYLTMEAWERAMMHDTPNELRAAAAEMDDLEYRTAYNKVADELEKLPRDGGLYQVEIDATPDDFLDWDLPLSEQSEAIKALGRDGETGSELYDRLGRTPGFVGDGARGYGATGQLEKGSIVSKKLNDMGIKGVKYKDEFSRGKDGGTSNYVIFDDRLITIAKKYGIAIPAAAALLMEQTGEDVTDKYQEI